MYHDKQHTKRQKGFTLIELMLSVGFIGSLLMVIALIIIQIMGIYNKGLTLKSVNEVSRIVVRDIQQSISGSDFFKIQYIDDTTNQPVDAVTLKQASEKTVDYYVNDAGGRLCTGVYSYAWNTGGALKAYRGSLFGGSGTETYKRQSNTTAPLGGYPLQFVERTLTDGSTQKIPVRFVKKRDTTKSLCRVEGSGATEQDINRFSSMLGSEKDYLNVFGSGNDELVLYSFGVTTPLKPTTDEKSDDITAISTFYHVSMVLGTQNGDENDEDGLIASSQSCKPPSEAEQNESEYCAVNKLEFVARTGRIGN